MTINVSPDPRLQFFGNDGKPLVGGKLYTYAAGTTTLLATYTDWYGTTPNTNPIILDSRGEASVWLGTARYKFVLKDANDVEVYTQDNLIMSPGADGAGSYGTWPIDISGNASTSTYATTAGSVTGGAVSSINGAGLYGFTLTGGPITTSGTLTVTPPTPGTAGNYMVSDGTNWVSQAFAGGNQFQNQLFTGSGTWTAPTGVTKVRATVIGGGGPGSDDFDTTSVGGWGGVAVGVYTVSPGTTYTVTVGVGRAKNSGVIGGTSSFSSFISATGGSAGTSTANGLSGTGSNGNLANSMSVDYQGAYCPSTFFRGFSGGLVSGNTGGNASAQVYSPVWANINRGAGANGYATASTGGIVFLEWVG